MRCNIFEIPSMVWQEVEKWDRWILTDSNKNTLSIKLYISGILFVLNCLMVVTMKMGISDEINDIKYIYFFHY